MATGKYPTSRGTRSILRARSSELSVRAASGTVFWSGSARSTPRSCCTTTTRRSLKVDPFRYVHRFLLTGRILDAAAKVDARRVTDLKEFVSQCDIITVNAPLHEGTKNLINADLLKHFKKVSLTCYLSPLLHSTLTRPSPLREHSSSTPRAAPFATPRTSQLRSSPASSTGTQATCGTCSPRRATTPGAR